MRQDFFNIYLRWRWMGNTQLCLGLDSTQKYSLNLFWYNGITWSEPSITHCCWFSYCRSLKSTWSLQLKLWPTDQLHQHYLKIIGNVKSQVPLQLICMHVKILKALLLVTKKKKEWVSDSSKGIVPLWKKVILFQFRYFFKLGLAWIM